MSFDDDDDHMMRLTLTPAGHSKIRVAGNSAMQVFANRLINEAMAARDILRVCPNDNPPTIEAIDDRYALTRYAECRERTDEAAREAGIGIESMRWA